MAHPTRSTSRKITNVIESDDICGPRRSAFLNHRFHVGWMAWTLDSMGKHDDCAKGLRGIGEPTRTASQYHRLRWPTVTQGVASRGCSRLRIYFKEGGRDEPQKRRAKGATQMCHSTRLRQNILLISTRRLPLAGHKMFSLAWLRLPNAAASAVSFSQGFAQAELVPRMWTRR